MSSAQDTVRQASLSRLRSEWGLNGPPELHVSRKRIADVLCVGVERTVASWRALGIRGSARYYGVAEPHEAIAVAMWRCWGFLCTLLEEAEAKYMVIVHGESVLLVPHMIAQRYAVTYDSPVWGLKLMTWLC